MMQTDYPTKMAAHLETAGGNVSKALALGLAAAATPAASDDLCFEYTPVSGAIPAGMQVGLPVNGAASMVKIPNQIPESKRRLQAEDKAQEQWAKAYTDLVIRELKPEEDPNPKKTENERRIVGEKKKVLKKLRKLVGNISPRLKKARQLAEYQLSRFAKPPERIKGHTEFYNAWVRELKKAWEYNRELTKFVQANGKKKKGELPQDAATRIFGKNVLTLVK